MAATSKLYFPDRGGFSVLGHGAISGFAGAESGSLSALPGSPFAIGVPFAGTIAIAPEGKRALVVDDFDNATFDPGVQGLSIDAAGAVSQAHAPLTPPSAAPFDVAISPNGQFAYVSADGGVQAYSLSDAGVPATIAGSPFGGTDTYQVVLTPDGRYVLALSLTQIVRYAVQPDGKLALLGTTPIGVAVPDAMAITPSGRFLYVISSTDDKLVTFGIAGDGSLNAVGSPVPLGGGTSVYWAVVAPSGNAMYLADYNANVRVFALAGGGAATQLASGTFSGRPRALVIAPDGRYIYVTDNTAPAPIEGFALNADGTFGAKVATAARVGGEGTQPSAVPAQAPTASFTAFPAGPGSATKLDGSASSDADGEVVRYDWDFGDGKTLANGSSKPRHTYSKAGVYSVRLTVTDDQNCSTAIVWAGYMAYCTGGPSATKTHELNTPPAITGLSVTNKRFAVASARRKRVKRGTAFRYRLSEAAKVSFTIRRRTTGRKVGKKCRKRSRKHATRRKCTRFVRVGVFKQAGKAGRNKRKFSGRIAHRKLRPGLYRATLVAIDRAKGSSAPKRVSFRVVRR
jgi:6-phosphogluconolactonase (cycloisomerase 2 family)